MEVRLEEGRDQLGIIQKPRQVIEYLRMEARVRFFPAISTVKLGKVILVRKGVISDIPSLGQHSPEYSGKEKLFSTYLTGMKVKSWKVLVTQLCLTLCDPMDYSPPGSPVHGIFQARTLKWVAIPFSRGSSQPRDRTHISCIASGFFTIWASRETHACLQKGLVSG